jgi:hypothetical protein
MSSNNHFNLLNNWQKNVCEYGGIFGVLLSLTCLIQHMVVAIPNSITNPMIPEYLLAITAFALLGFQKAIAPLLIIISTVYAGIVEYLWMSNYAFSLVVLLLFIYHIIIIVAVFTEQIPQKLNQIKKLKKEEKDLWAGKI